jgi:hypothetical protein
LRYFDAGDRLLPGLGKLHLSGKAGDICIDRRLLRPNVGKETQMIGFNRKRTAVLAALGAAGILAGTTAIALTGGAGGSETRIDVRAETSASTTSSTVFVDIPGANVTVSVPAGTSRLFTARFAGESQCFGQAVALAWCSLQIIATNAGGASIPFNPASGLDYAFDSNPGGTADDLWEGNAMERDLRLQPGTYRIRVQRAVTNAATTFRLDDWHFAVETNL